jgi:acyl-coenzyme A thioesterase PaaI-like protein
VDEPKQGQDRDARIRAADAVRALAGVLVERVATAEELTRIADSVEDLTLRLEAGEVRDIRAGYRAWIDAGLDANLEVLERAAGGAGNPTAVPIVCHAGADGLFAEVVVAEVFASWPGSVHVGMVGAILDDVLGQLAIAVGGFAATTRLEIDFRRPTPTGRPLRVEARLVAREGRVLHIEGAILDGSTELVTAKGQWVTIETAGLVF